MTDLTIAITVYDRRRFIEGAVGSALGQTMPCQVIVVEDCGPDTGLKDFVEDRFGGRIRYYRNSRRRGLFGNWNSCLELCQTPWLSILHDDDLLKPYFRESMQRWMELAPGKALYFGDFEVMDESGELVEYRRYPVKSEIEALDLVELAEANRLGFPGHAINVAIARRLGGFREKSQFCGDWEMWFRLAAEAGAIRGNKVLSRVRFYHDEKRGTSKVMRSGKCFGLTIVQRKRNRQVLARHGIRWNPDQRRLRGLDGPFPRFLLANAARMSARWLRYNAKLFQLSDCKGASVWLLRLMVALGGAQMLLWLSRLYRFGSDCLNMNRWANQSRPDTKCK